MAAPAHSAAPGRHVLIEICVEDLGGVDAAVQGGADRLEICADVSTGGLTPSDALVDHAVAAAPPSGVQVLIRPRAGDFVYTPEEVAAMAADIARMRTLWPGGPLGFVVGALTVDGHVDVTAASALRDAAGPAPLTFHRGIDATPDPVAAMQVLAGMGYDRVLTTGGHASVADVDGLRRMVDAGGEQLTVIGSGGLRAHNVAQVVHDAHLTEVHMRAPSARVALSDAAAPLGESTTDRAEVERIVAALA
ncbi:copper homeostasis protein CutC [Demequina sp. B12]|uniref:copper homeostasis protein CutC n=1 Tax=Demequina sp. B12 TaxID=2992757 RepID=UPI00237B4408|nr:copper homeostasis protein CutC [Demequina sp. B12]MDE0572469.1 copper homeostasis protein CutC [Demequina sp. B12]